MSAQPATHVLSSSQLQTLKAEGEERTAQAGDTLSDLLLNAFVERRELLQQRHGIGPQIIGSRDWPDTRRLLDFVRAMKVPYTWIDPLDPNSGVTLDGNGSATAPLVRLPGGEELP